MTSSPEAVHYALEGYFDKMRIEESWQRHAAYINFRVMGGKERIENIWPMQDEKKESEGFEISQEMYDLINTRYKTK